MISDAKSKAKSVMLTDEGQKRAKDGEYVALCPELDIASQGNTVEQARLNLKEALELFFETASKQEIRDRLHDEVFITRPEIAVG